MDSITQALLGAAVGEVVLGKKVGNKAPLWGATAGILPDLDVIPGQFMETVAGMAFHRGFSHSLLFAVAVAPLAGWLIQKIHKNGPTVWRDWAVLYFWGIATHILLDCFTTWGTQVFWPLDYRVAWNTIFVIDPLYSLPLAAFTLALMLQRPGSTLRIRLGYLGLLISSVYLLITVVNKQIAHRAFEDAWAEQGIEYLRYHSRPTPFNSILWSVTVETEDGFYEGYYSLLDRQGNIPFTYMEKNHHLIDKIENFSNIRRLIKLTRDYYTLDTWEHGILINDLRFGLFNGWQEGGGPVVFSYRVHLQQNAGENTDRLKVERIRNVTTPDRQTLVQFWKRVTGV